MDKDSAILQLENVYGHSCQRVINKARKYVEGRTWDKCVDVLEQEIQECLKK